jgi:hypothetical protein
MISISPVATYFFKQTAPIAPPAETTGASGEETTHFSSAGEAVGSVLADSDPRVIAFAEPHPQPDYRTNPYRTAKAYFTDEVLPVLQREGITDLIIEQIINDPAIENDDPAVEDELDYFYRTGRFGSISTPTLWRTIEKYADRWDLIHMLFRARDRGIRVHPGGITIAEAEKTIWRPDWGYNPETELLGWGYFEAGGRAAVDRLLATGRRFAIYNGTKHHARLSDRITEEEGGTNYGEYLEQTLGDGYMEMEIYPAERLGTLSSYVIDLIGMNDWRELTPESGVNLLERGQSHILIIAPE